MGWLSGARNFVSLSNLAPIYYKRREVAKLEAEIAKARLTRLKSFYDKSSNRTNRDNIRSFDAVKGDRFNYDITGLTEDADSALQGNNKALRQYVRELEYNNGNVAGPIQRLADHVIGTGLQFQSRVLADKENIKMLNIPRIGETTAESFNFWFEKWFSIWAKKKNADYKQTSTWSEMQHLIELALIRDGEVLVIARTSDKANRLIPYCIEVVEIDRLSTPMDMKNDPKIRNGIKVDDEGAPSAYFISKQHPGSRFGFGLKSSEYSEIPKYSENGTEQVMHLFSVLRPEQTRGFSQLASGLKDIQNAVRYQEAEMFCALEDACMFGIVTTTNAGQFNNNTTITDPNNPDNRIHEFSPNTIKYLNNDEKMDINKPSRPNDKFDEIIQSFFRGPANGLNIPPEVFMQNWRGMNYSNARTVLIQFYYMCRMKQKYMVSHLCSPVQEGVFKDLILKGMISAPGWEYRLDDYLSAEWIPPKRDWVDPVKEPAGKQIELELGSVTPAGISAASGGDFETNAEITAHNLKFKKDLEIKYGIKFPSSSQNIKEEEKEEEEEEDEETGTNDDVKKTKKG